MKRLLYLFVLLCPTLFGQTNAYVMPVPNMQFLDCRTGICTSLVGGFLYSYQAGTTTPLATFTSSSGGISNPDPIVLNATGQNPGGSGSDGIWLGSNCYKFVLQDSLGVTLWTQDNVCNLQALLAAASGASIVGYAPPSGGTTTTVASYLDQAILDSYGTLSSACTAATSLGRPLLITKAWTSISKFTCTAPLIFYGGSIQPGVGQVVTLSGGIVSAPMQEIFDESVAGAASVLATNARTDRVYPQWWGAKGDGTTDDTVAIQAALDYCGLNGCTVLLPATSAGSQYKISSTLKMYRTGLPYSGMTFCGEGPIGTSIYWAGGSANDVIQMDGYTQTVCRMRIQSITNTVGWRDAIAYGAGDLTTAGVIDHVWIDCNGNPGNGIGLGRLGVQGDQGLVNKPEIINCTSGFGIESLNTNAVDNVIINPSITNCWIAMGPGTTSINMSVFGGSINDNALNFTASAGNKFTISGVRTEGSSRTYFDSVGLHANAITFTGLTIDTISPTRVATTTTASATACTIPLTYTDDHVANTKFTFGDQITIAGAGTAGGTLHTQIVAMSSTVSATLNACIVTGVTGAAVALDGSVRQNQFEEHSSGPYVHNNVAINLVGGGTAGVTIALGGQTFNGYSTSEVITNPMGLPSTTMCPTNVSWTAFNNNSNVSATSQPDYSATVEQKLIPMTSGTGSANNALVGFPVSWCTPNDSVVPTDLTISLNTGAFTLQAGANTLNLFGLVEPLKSHFNPANNIATAYAVNSQINVVWNVANSVWLDLSQ